MGSVPRSWGPQTHQRPDATGLAAAVLAEVVALRAIQLNVHFHLCSGAPVTAETMQRLIDRTDQAKPSQRHLHSVGRSRKLLRQTGATGCSVNVADSSARRKLL